MDFRQKDAVSVQADELNIKENFLIPSSLDCNNNTITVEFTGMFEHNNEAVKKVADDMLKRINPHQVLTSTPYQALIAKYPPAMIDEMIGELRARHAGELLTKEQAAKMLIHDFKL